MANPNWSDIYTADELAAALDVQSARIAKRFGAYDIAGEIKLAADCIRDLSERCEFAATRAECMAVEISEIQRQTLAAIESMSKLP